MNQYKTKTEDIVIEGISFKLTQVINSDSLIDSLIQNEQQQGVSLEDNIPYWAELWPSAIALTKHLLKNKVINKDKSVLEIGCGLGLPGIASGYYSSKVTLTDLLKEPLEFARMNWDLNHKHTANFAQLDWRTPPISFAADIVLASDIAYESRSFEYLTKSFKTLCKPGGLILISEPNRSLAKPFFQLLQEENMVVDLTEYTILLNSIATRVNVHTLQLPAPAPNT